MAYDPLRVFCKLARNNRLANFRLHQACFGLSQEALIAHRVSFFPTLRATLNHIYIVDRFYIDALQGGTLGPAAFAQVEPFATVAELRIAQAELDETLIAFVDGLDEDGLATSVNIHRGARIQQDRCDDVLSHLFQHQTHHRGQAHAMLSGTGIKPPQLDEFIVGDDAKARKDEMDALGWTETDLMFPAGRSR
ncbi:damage-inducible protein DinB [Agrobacterium sp. ICMP 6402]|uniref:DinB family protein n=1 Tax=Agrobacterium sp. ICMP 6402 TaxID=2292443 RepID=UPI001297FCDE|nr:DinB family protein [Agrobacterium sp. ICMP 6402]MQB10109.1 damage-inducible protein DinB [Agrobacterium sp. ICMP 6402]